MKAILIIAIINSLLLCIVIFQNRPKIPVYEQYKVIENVDTTYDVYMYTYRHFDTIRINQN